MIFFFTVWKKNPYVYRIFSPQLKYVCMSVSFSNYLATHTQGSCIKFPTSEVRAASPLVSCPTGRQKGQPAQHHQHLHSTCRCSSEGQFTPSVTSHAHEGQRSPSLGPSTSKRLHRAQSRGSTEPGTRSA